MPGFQENLVCVGPMCDAYYTVTFNNHAVTIYSPTGTPVVTGWCETDAPRIWCMSQLPTLEYIPRISSSLDFHKNLP